MKFMVVFSTLLACSMAQILSPYTYAPSYTYGAFGARTALDVFPFSNGFAGAGYYANHYSGLLPTAAAAPVVASTVAAPAVVAKAIDEAEVVEAVAAVDAPRLRPIFPVFGSGDLRGGVSAIEFARPDQVLTINPDAAADDDFVVILPQTRSLPAPVTSTAAAAPYFPAGIFQSTQPRFYSSFNPYFGHRLF